MIHRLEVILLASWLPAALIMIGLSFGWRSTARIPDHWGRRLLGVAGAGLLIAYTARECLALALMYIYNLPTFYVYRLAADIGLHQGWDHLYDLDLYHFAVYFNPPPLAWLVALVTPLPIAAGYTAWVALQLILVVAIAMVLAPSRYDMLLLYLLVAVSIVGQTFTLVESSLIVVAAVALSWRLLVADRQILAGLVLAAIAIKPNLAVLVPVALALAGRRRAFVSWAAATIPLVVASFALLGKHGVDEYLASLQIYSSTPGQHTFALEGLLGMSPSTYLIQFVAGGLALYAAFRSRARPIGLAVAAGLIGSALVSPTFHTYDWIAPLLGVCLLWISAPSPTTGAFVLFATLLSYADISHPFVQEFLWFALEVGCMAWLAMDIPDVITVGMTLARRAASQHRLSGRASPDVADGVVNPRMVTPSHR